MPSGCARRWAGCSAATGVTEPGFTVRLTGMIRQHSHIRRHVWWDTRDPMDQPHPHITTASGFQAAWMVQLAPLSLLGFCHPYQGELDRERVASTVCPETGIQRPLLKMQVVVFFSFPI